MKLLRCNDFGRLKRSCSAVEAAILAGEFEGNSEVLLRSHGCGSKFKSSGKPQVLVFGSICQGAILVHGVEPLPFWEMALTVKRNEMRTTRPLNEAQAEPANL